MTLVLFKNKKKKNYVPTHNDKTEVQFFLV